jgi:hypothetical protein
MLRVRLSQHERAHVGARFTGGTGRGRGRGRRIRGPGTVPVATLKDTDFFIAASDRLDSCSTSAIFGVVGSPEAAEGAGFCTCHTHTAHTDARATLKMCIGAGNGRKTNVRGWARQQLRTSGNLADNSCCPTCRHEAAHATHQQHTVTATNIARECVFWGRGERESPGITSKKSRGVASTHVHQTGFGTRVRGTGSSLFRRPQCGRHG